MPSEQTQTHAAAVVGGDDILGDVIHWRKKKLSLTVLLTSTATWVVFELLGYKFLPVASWIGIVSLTAAFLWSCLSPLFGRTDPPADQMFGSWEVPAQSAVETANGVRVKMEEGFVGLLDVVVVKHDWVVFGEIIAGLLFAAWLGSYFDLLTLIYLGVCGGLALPPIYDKYKEGIRDMAEKAREKGRRSLDMIREHGNRGYDFIKEKGSRSYDTIKEKGNKSYDMIKEKGNKSYDVLAEKEKRFKGFLDEKVLKKKKDDVAGKEHVPKEKKTE